MADSFPCEESKCACSERSSLLLSKIQDAWDFLLTHGYYHSFRMVLKESSLDQSCMDFLLGKARGLPEHGRFSKIMVRQTPSIMSESLAGQFVEFIALNEQSLEELSLSLEFESMNGVHAQIHPLILSIIPRLSRLKEISFERCNLSNVPTRDFIIEFFCPSMAPNNVLWVEPYARTVFPQRHQTAKLTLRDCTLSGETSWALCRALESYSGLKEVSLQGLEMPSESANELLNALITSPSDLRSVGLISMELKKDSLPLLAALLRRHGKLKTLDLDWNFTLFARAASAKDTNGLEVFAQELSRHSCLKELNMEECSISKSELTILFRALESNRCLGTFHLASNFGLHIGDWIKSFPKLSIKSLNMSDSLPLKIPEEDQDVFLSALAKNTSLKECILHWTGIKWQKVDAFLRRNHVLEKVQELTAFPKRKLVDLRSWPMILQHIGNYGDASSVQLFMKIMREQFLLAKDPYDGS